MEWLSQNWVWVLIGVAFVAMLGLVESFLYGAYAGLVFCPISNLLHRRWGAQANPNA